MTWRLNTRGRNRFVLLTRRYAIKFPSLRCWQDFLYGILNNLTEAKLGRSERWDVCPVLWASWGGFVIVMPRVAIMTDAGLRLFAWDDWLGINGTHDAPRLSVEIKPDSFGLYNGRIVAVDYGWQH